MAAICAPAYYNTRLLDTIYSKVIDAHPMVRFFLLKFEFVFDLIHFSLHFTFI